MIHHYLPNVPISALILELLPYLFTIHGVKSFLSERISQDPLEKYFGRQRQHGGVNDNPNAPQFFN